LGIPKCALVPQNILTVSVNGISVGQAKLSFTGTNVIGVGAAVAFVANGGAYNISAVSPLTQINPTSCAPNWQAGGWSVCTNGQQTRTVTDSNNCGITTNEPETIQSCAPPVLFDIAAQPMLKTSNNMIFVWVAVFVFFIFVVVLLFWAYSKRRKGKIG
jgi:disulfide bond formation protein DsbB